jgi:hypothetical protein
MTSIKSYLTVLVSASFLLIHGDELLLNHEFDNNLDNWYPVLTFPSDTIKAQKFTWGTDVLFILKNGGTNSWDVQLYQNIKIRKGYRYDMYIGGSGLGHNKTIHFDLSHNGNTGWGGDSSGIYTEYTAASVQLRDTGYVEFNMAWNNVSVNDSYARVAIEGGGNALSFSISWVSISESPIDNSSFTINIDGGNIINTLSDHFFGQNYFCWNPTYGNFLAGTEAMVSPLNLKFLRSGGIDSDVGFPDAVTSPVLSAFSAYCKAVKAEPLLQLQIARFNNMADRVKNAALMLDTLKSFTPVNYVSIGNEPDLYSTSLSADTKYNVSYLKGYSLSDYCADFNAVAAEIRKKSPDIKTIGLELAWNRDQWIPGFVSACKNNVDMLSVHYYPFEAAHCIYDSVRNQVGAIQNFYSSTRTLIDRNASGKTIPLIIGECNVSFDGDPAKSTRNASPGTFLAGLWMADFIGVSSSQKNLFSIMPWCISDGDWALGFLNANKKPKPVYTVYKMFSTLSRKNLVHSESPNSYTRIYCFKDDKDTVSLFAVNWDTVSSYNATIHFNSILKDSTYHYKLPPQSLSCIVFSPDFKNKNITVFTPQTTKVNVGAFSRHDQEGGVVKAFFETKTSTLRVIYDKTLSEPNISIVNLIGRRLFTTYPVETRKGILDIPVHLKDISPGLYFLIITNNRKGSAKTLKIPLNIYY